MNIPRRSFLGGSLALGALTGCRMTGGLFASHAAPRFEFGPDGRFKFFMIADWHRSKGRSDTEREIAFFKRAVEKHSPELVVFAGDNVCSRQNKCGLYEELMSPVVEAFKDTGVKLCVTFGNHDAEHHLHDLGYYSRRDQYNWLRAELGDLFVDYDVPGLTGVGTGKVELFKRGASWPLFKIYIADSGAYAVRGSNGAYAYRKGYDNPHGDQIEWYYRDSFDGVPHIWVQHIIVPDANIHGLFEKADPAEDGAYRNFYMPDGSLAVLKLAKRVPGVCKERTCPPRWNVYRDARHTYKSMTLYDAWRASGCMKGAFFGHDHMNTFDGVDRNGIRLGMIKSFNCGGSYGDGVAGFRVFEVREDGSFKTETETERTV